MKNRIMILLLSLFVLTSCASQSSDSRNLVEQPYKKREFLLGTYVQVRIFDKGKEDLLTPAFELMKRLGNEIDSNDDQNESEIDKINEASGKKAVVVNEEIFYLVKKAKEYSEESNGKFDLTIGVITQLWHIGFEDAQKPTQSEIDQALQLVNYQDVELDEQKHSVFLKKEGMKLDLGAIAKGFITDKVVEFLQKNGVTTAIVDLGGNVFVLGHSYRGADIPWTVGIQDPNKARNTEVGTLLGVNASFVTSGIYERYLKVNGEVYHHIMNPKTGYPFDNELAGVTIVSEKSIDGDGLSTTVFALGLSEGMKYIESHKGVEAVFVTKDDKIYKTSGVEKTFELDKGSGYFLGE
ncbi:thiamine biosynthesis lipoprotein [Pilibacter termitis]|uniref:FAD:protein FMN transferase n=1 Tax=Pilibacter termitis TaxID=263852 RepID=A0A1T4Q2S5_9ENTE|nr:FAD:protein FMN transferase [Pilibacter termitis]SJZ97964.1 thiamine biosynthesis lipoprotein [Pilibacter termitis]